jgi:hypothetical protein
VSGGARLVSLSRTYPSIWHRPVLTRVDLRIFELRYFRRCLACGFCKDHCCSHGVDIDARNVERLLALGRDFERHVGTPRQHWFTTTPVADDEFPARSHFRTLVKQGYCVFHEPGGRGCRIHSWCAERGLDYRHFKPLVSILFPLTFESSVLVPSTELLDGTLACGGEGDILYDGVRDELAYFFGQGCVVELDAVRERTMAQVPISSSERL